LQDLEKAREVYLEKRKELDSQKNNPQEDMLFIQKEFRTLTQGRHCFIQKWIG
jgi:hypothetical protein